MKKLLALVIIIAFLLAIKIWINFRQEGVHFAYSMNKESYGLMEKTSSDTSSQEKVYGGIVSHHLLVADKIAQIFATIGKQSPSTLVIIGPNHFSNGDGNILVSKYKYLTAWGSVDSDLNIINKLLNLSVVNNDENPFTQEHSISALVSYVKYYSPKTKIIPIIVKRGTAESKLENLALNLDLLLPKDAVVIASVDFSHHLSSLAADFHDQMSISAITNFDYDRIFKSEIDSPASIYTVLRYLELRGAQKITWEQTNSAQVTGNVFGDDVTSYMFATFSPGTKTQFQSVSILSFGDMMLGREVENAIKKDVNPFEKIRGVEGNFLKGVDFLSANLEGPISNSQDCNSKLISFRFNPSAASLIAKSGINIVNLANNHAFDCKLQGIVDTKRFLNDAHISYFGGIDGLYEENNVGFVGIDITSRNDDMALYYSLIKDMKAQNKFVVVNIHWGDEDNSFPSTTQTNLGHLLIDNGADVVVGHHPHVIEPVEIYHNKPIFYSLGNFVFDQVNLKQNEGVGVGTVVENNQTKYYLFPFKINNYQPILLKPADADVFCNEFLKGIPLRKGCYFSLKWE